MDGPADGGEDRSGLEGVVGHCAGEAQNAWEGRFFDGDDLDVRHLVLRNGEERGGVGFCFACRVGSHIGFGLSGAATRERCN